MGTKGETNGGSGAVQQKVGTNVDFAKLTNEQLHQETLDARNKLFEKCENAHQYIANVLLPRCTAIIARYKKQGVAAKDRPNGQPTVEAYFKSIGLNYNNVRSWIRRNRLKTELFKNNGRAKCAECCKRGVHAKWCSKYKTPSQHLTEVEAQLIGKIWAGNDVVEAVELGGNVDEALKAYKEQKPTFEQVKDYIQRPVKTLAANLKGLTGEKLATALCCELRRLVQASENEAEVIISQFGYDCTAGCFTFRVEVPSKSPSPQPVEQASPTFQAAQNPDIQQGGVQ